MSKGRKLAGVFTEGKCGERAVCEELGETKWSKSNDADDTDDADGQYLAKARGIPSSTS